MDLSEKITVYGYWNQAPWNTSAGTNITSRIRRATWSLGFSGTGPKSGVVAPPRQLILDLDNQDGYFDPDHPSAVTFLTDDRIRVDMDDGAAGTNIFFDGFLQQIEPVHVSSRHNVARLVAVDSMTRLADADLAQDTDVDGFERDGELTGTRISAILTEIGWGGSTAIDAGTVYMEPKTYDFSTDTNRRITFQSALQAIKEAVEIENGFFWTTRTGQLQFRDRFALEDTTAYDTSQLTVTGSIMKSAPTRSSLGRFHSVNRTAAVGASGRPRAFGDTAANAPRTSHTVRMDEASYDADARATAESWQRRNKYTNQVPLSAEFQCWPAANNSAYAAFFEDLNMGILNRLLFDYRPAGWGVDFEPNVRVAGWATNVDLASGITTRLDLWPFDTRYETQVGSNQATFNAAIGTKLPGV